MAGYVAAIAQEMPGMKMPQKQTAQQTQKVIYTCPMHPEIKMAKPGNCPKCGMVLVKKTIKVAVAKPATQTATPAQMPAADKPAAKQMDMPMEDKNDSKLPVTYTCPMHPEIHSGSPGNCPKCGMKLVKEKPAAHADMPGMEGMQAGEEDATMDNIK